MRRKRVDEYELDDEMDQDTPRDDMWNGNRRRKLWKATCIRAVRDVRSSCLHLVPLVLIYHSLQTHLTEAERIVYAALCPTVETAAILLSTACRTWEDVVWAQVSVLIEEKQNEALAVLGGGGFWEGGLAAVEKSGREADKVRDEDMDMDRSGSPAEDEEFLDEKWRDEMVRTLALLSSAPVQDG